jgi:hypothetical protein
MTPDFSCQDAITLTRKILSEFGFEAAPDGAAKTTCSSNCETAGRMPQFSGWIASLCCGRLSEHVLALVSFAITRHLLAQGE